MPGTEQLTRTGRIKQKTRGDNNRPMIKRKAYLDRLRVIAIALVIYNHLPAYALADKNVPGQLIYVFLAAATRINVPLLLMVSGGLLLNREEDIRTLLKKRVLRFAVALTLFYLGLYTLRLLHDTILYGAVFAFSPGEFIRGLFSHSLIPADAGSYWFLYAYLLYLLMLPFLRSIAHNMQKSHFILITVLHAAIYTILPLVNLLLSACGLQALTLSNEISVPTAVASVFFYPLIGYWIEEKASVTSLTRRNILILTAVSLAGLLTASLLYCKAGMSNALFLFDWTAALTVFLIFKRTETVRDTENAARKKPGLIRIISTISFGIYLLDPYLKLLLFGAYYKAASRLPELISSLIWIPVSMAIGGCLTWLLKKVPGFRKLL